jgi:uncharacterized membrane protein
MHNLGWRLLINSTRKPKQLAKSAEHIQKVNESSRSSKMGTIINVAILVLSWWFPYIALILSLILWIFWVFVATKINK